ncbi:hypothetical protein mRhiFer1_008682 [Rhinolophus ferrumequinum]|uniref:Uncharacterized protein n=1 Tax=Rhinolophus ferrumequinum TaxID=59479 RepID=A0A7J7TRC9_RHIFE|nr:hypothetical protein mRhiFer1_008682 [Rhinolophus ferrumequinum]
MDLKVWLGCKCDRRCCHSGDPDAWWGRKYREDISSAPTPPSGAQAHLCPEAASWGHTGVLYPEPAERTAVEPQYAFALPGYTGLEQLCSTGDINKNACYYWSRNPRRVGRGGRQEGGPRKWRKAQEAAMCQDLQRKEGPFGTQKSYQGVVLFNGI